MAAGPTTGAAVASCFVAQLGLVVISSILYRTPVPGGTTTTTGEFGQSCPLCDCPPAGYSGWYLAFVGASAFLGGIGFVTLACGALGLVAGFWPGLLTGWLATRFDLVESRRRKDAAVATSSAGGGPEDLVPIPW